MKGMVPQQVQSKDVLVWFNESFQLMYRNILGYLVSVILFFTSLFLIGKVIVAAEQFFPDFILLVFFLLISGTLFYFFIAGLIMVSYCSDHTQNIHITDIARHFKPGHRAFFKLAFIAISVGFSYWYFSILLNPRSDVFIISEKAIELLIDENTIIFYLLKTGAIFLIFLLMVSVTLRTFFSVPLVIFHNLNYFDAKQLSHDAILKNIKPMIYVMVIWFILFSASLTFIPSSVIVLMPLFATFGYVSYRHIFLGQGLNNEAVKKQRLASA